MGGRRYGKKGKFPAPRRDIWWNDLVLEGLKQERRIRTDETVRTGNQDAGNFPFFP